MSQFATNILRSRGMIVFRLSIIFAIVGALLWAFSAPASAQEQDIRWAQRQMGYFCSWSGECYKPYRQYQQIQHHRRYVPHQRRYTPSDRDYWVPVEREPRAEYQAPRRYEELDRDRWHSRYGEPRQFGERGDQCRDVIDVLSTEHTSDEHAKDAARKLWMAKTQWLHGGQYMDLQNADDVLWRCSASNAHDTFSSRMSESIGKAVGRDGQNSRCALWARPCRAARAREGDRRER